MNRTPLLGRNSSYNQSPQIQNGVFHKITAPTYNDYRNNPIHNNRDDPIDLFGFEHSFSTPLNIPLVENRLK
jgi:hypothetical protein